MFRSLIVLINNMHLYHGHVVRLFVPFNCFADKFVDAVKKLNEQYCNHKGKIND